MELLKIFLGQFETEKEKIFARRLFAVLIALVYIYDATFADKFDLINLLFSTDMLNYGRTDAYALAFREYLWEIGVVLILLEKKEGVNFLLFHSGMKLFYVFWVPSNIDSIHMLLYSVGAVYLTYMILLTYRDNTEENNSVIKTFFLNKFLIFGILIMSCCVFYVIYW